MRNQFRGFFKPSDAQLERLWSECLFVLDTSVLLNIYPTFRTSPAEFLRISCGCLPA